MNLNSNLTNENLLLYAAKFYDNPNCDGIDEFYNDLSIPLHIKKLLTRHSTGYEIKERLLLNHFISLLNVFPLIVASKILFLKIEEKHYYLIATVLKYLELRPNPMIINGKTINIDKINFDQNLLDRLNKC